MEMLTFSRQDDREPEFEAAATNPTMDHQLDGDLRAAILDLAAGNGSIQDVLQGYIAGAASVEEVAPSVHAALREAGRQVSREAVEEALEAIAAEIRPPEPEPEPAPEASSEVTEDGSQMHIVTLLEKLDQLGVKLRCGRTEDRLHVTPRASLEAKHVAAIREHKEDIIRLLRDYELEQSDVLQDERQVFEAFRQAKVVLQAAGRLSE